MEGAVRARLDRRHEDRARRQGGRRVAIREILLADDAVVDVRRPDLPGEPEPEVRAVVCLHQDLRRPAEHRSEDVRGPTHRLVIDRDGGFRRALPLVVREAVGLRPGPRDRAERHSDLLLVLLDVLAAVRVLALEHRRPFGRRDAAHRRGVRHPADVHVRVDVIRDAEAMRGRLPQLVLAKVLELTEERIVRIEEDRGIRADLVRLDRHLRRQVDGLGPRLDDDCLVRSRLQTVSDDAPRDVRHALPGGVSRAALIRIEARPDPEKPYAVTAIPAPGAACEGSLRCRARPSWRLSSWPSR